MSEMNNKTKKKRRRRTSTIQFFKYAILKKRWNWDLFVKKQQQQQFECAKNWESRKNERQRERETEIGNQK